MAAINLRKDRERPLTIEEVDHNFDAINREVGTKLDAISFNATNILEILDGHAGAGTNLDADMLHTFYPNFQAVPETVVVRDELGNIIGNQIFGQHVGDVVGNVVGNLTGTVTGNATNVDGTVQLDHGGTGAVNAIGARANLGLGSIAIQNKNEIDITGGSITGITDLLVADGGTGASTALGARANLGVVIGADVQAYHAILSGISGTTGDGFLTRSSTNSAVARIFEAGNSIKVTNGNGKDGNVKIELDLNPTVTSIIKSGNNGSGDVGSSGNRFGTFWGTASSAKYADLAEIYGTDKEYTHGTVIVVNPNENSEATASFENNQRVLGVISTAPAYIMNDEAEGQAIALRGRVPVRVVGKIKKGQMLVSTSNGTAQAGDSLYSFAQALESNDNEGENLIECVIY